jgi:hypothetical protein
MDAQRFYFHLPQTFDPMEFLPSRMVMDADFARYFVSIILGRNREGCSVTTTTIYHDALLRALLVVSHGGRFWLVPARAGGWSARMPLALTEQAKAQRLRPAKDVSPEWLGGPQSRINADGPGAVDATAET